MTVINFPLENEVDRLVSDCEDAGIYVSVRTSNAGIHPFFSFGDNYDPDKYLEACHEIAKLPDKWETLLNHLKEA